MNQNQLKPDTWHLTQKFYSEALTALNSAPKTQKHKREVITKYKESLLTASLTEEWEIHSKLPPTKRIISYRLWESGSLVTCVVEDITTFQREIMVYRQKMMVLKDHKRVRSFLDPFQKEGSSVAYAEYREDEDAQNQILAVSEEGGVKILPVKEREEVLVRARGRWFDVFSIFESGDKNGRKRVDEVLLWDHEHQLVYLRFNLGYRNPPEVVKYSKFESSAYWVKSLNFFEKIGLEVPEGYELNSLSLKPLLTPRNGGYDEINHLAIYTDFKAKKRAKREKRGDEKSAMSKNGLVIVSELSFASLRPNIHEFPKIAKLAEYDLYDELLESEVSNLRYLMVKRNLLVKIINRISKSSSICVPLLKVKKTSKELIVEVLRLSFSTATNKIRLKDSLEYKIKHFEPKNLEEENFEIFDSDVLSKTTMELSGNNSGDYFYLNLPRIMDTVLILEIEKNGQFEDFRSSYEICPFSAMKLKSKSIFGAECSPRDGGAHKLFIMDLTDTEKVKKYIKQFYPNKGQKLTRIEHREEDRVESASDNLINSPNLRITTINGVRCVIFLKIDFRREKVIIHFEELTNSSNYKEVTCAINFEEEYRLHNGESTQKYKIQFPSNSSEIRLHFNKDLTNIVLSGFTLHAKSNFNSFDSDRGQKKSKFEFSSIFSLTRKMKPKMTGEESKSFKKLFDYHKGKVETYFYPGSHQNVNFSFLHKNPIFMAKIDNEKLGIFEANPKHAKMAPEMQDSEAGPSVDRSRCLEPYADSRLIQAINLAQRDKKKAKMEFLYISDMFFDPKARFFAVEVIHKNKLIIPKTGSSNKATLDRRFIEIWTSDPDLLKAALNSKKAQKTENSEKSKNHIFSHSQTILSSYCTPNPCSLLWIDEIESLMVQNHLYKLTRSPTLEFQHNQSNPLFEGTVYLRASQDSQFMISITYPAPRTYQTLQKSSFHPEYKIIIWRINEDKTLSYMFMRDKFTAFALPCPELQYLVSLKEGAAQMRVAKVKIRQISQNDPISLDWGFLKSCLPIFEYIGQREDGAGEGDLVEVVSTLKGSFYAGWRSNQLLKEFGLVSESLEKILNELKIDFIQGVDRDPRMPALVVEGLPGYYLIYLVSTCLQNDLILGRILEFVDYRLFFYRDGFDPFMDAVERRDVKILDVFASYLAQDRNLDILETMFDNEKFTKIMLSGSRAVQEVLLDHLFKSSPPYTPLNEDFWENQMMVISDSETNFYPLNSASDIKSFQIETNSVPEEAEDRLNGDLTRAKKFNKKIFKVDRIVSRVEFSPSVANTSCRNLLRVAQDLSPGLLEDSDYKYLVDFIWRKNKWGWVFGLHLIEYLFLSSSAVYLVLLPEEWFAYSLNITFAILMTVLALAGFLKGNRARISSPGLVVFLLYPIEAILSSYIYFEEIPKTDHFFNFLVALITLGLGFRALYLLGTFERPRFLNLMIWEIFGQIFGFFFLIFLLLLVFTMAGLNIIGQSASPEGYKSLRNGNFGDVRNQFNFYYNFIFGGWENFEQFERLNGYEFAFCLILTVFLALIISNLVISLVIEKLGIFDKKWDQSSREYTLRVLCYASNIATVFKSDEKLKIDENDRKSMKHLFLILSKEMYQRRKRNPDHAHTANSHTSEPTQNDSSDKISTIGSDSQHSESRKSKDDKDSKEPTDPSNSANSSKSSDKSSEKGKKDEDSNNSSAKSSPNVSKFSHGSKKPPSNTDKDSEKTATDYMVSSSQQSTIGKGGRPGRRSGSISIPSGGGKGPFPKKKKHRRGYPGFEKGSSLRLKDNQRK